jgi:hypothetical protein
MIDKDSINFTNGESSHIYVWFLRNKLTLLAINTISTILLFPLHLFTVTIQITIYSFPEKIIQSITAILLLLILLSVIWKGMLSILICGLGIILIYSGIILPSYSLSIPGEHNFKGIKLVDDPQSMGIASHGYFFLGIIMIILSTIIAYKPSILYVKNRPQSMNKIWLNYPIWYDNIKIICGHNEPNIRLNRLMSEQEKYLSWRYEYILTDIYGELYLVKPDSRVPESSTILRNNKNRAMIGIARYGG